MPARRVEMQGPRGVTLPVSSPDVGGVRKDAFSPGGLASEVQPSPFPSLAQEGDSLAQEGDSDSDDD